MKPDLNGWKKQLEERAESIYDDPRAVDALMERQCLHIADLYEETINTILEMVEEMVEEGYPEMALELLDDFRGQFASASMAMPDGPQRMRLYMLELLEMNIRVLDEAEQWVKESSDVPFEQDCP